ncbi:MAG: MFS family permease [Neolewinella sp.]
MNAANTAISEWRKAWFVPLTAALGYATATMYVYSIGPFIEPIQAEFGWSRAQVSSGITIAASLSAIFCIPMGILVDKIGPRWMGLVGVTLMCAAVAMLSTATGSGSNWIFLWCLLAFATLWVQATVWTSAVNGRFVKSRGLALAITLSGASLAATVFPLTASWLIENFGWRTAYLYLSGGWAILALPALFLGFKGIQDQSKSDTATIAKPKDLPGLSIKEGLRTPALYKLIMAGGFFAFTAIGIVTHFVPILTDSGASTMQAAGVASLIGIFSIIGRLGTGFLLDRYPAHIVGAIAFIIPIIACSLLLTNGSLPAFQILAAAIFGLTLGSEVDVIAYIAAKYFGLKNFGALYGAAVMALSMGTALGPLAAGAVFDHYGSYAPFLQLTAVLMGASAIALFTMGNPPNAAVAAEEIISAEVLES